MSKTDKSHSSKSQSSTLAELLKEKPRRGRPPREVSRQNVYVMLRPGEKALMKQLTSLLPTGIKRADLADLAITAVTVRLEALRLALTGRNREIPEGITDLDSLYLLWDIPLPETPPAEKWTSIRVSPQQVIELGRAHGALNGAFGATRSETFSLGLAILAKYLETNPIQTDSLALEDVRDLILNAY